MPGSQRWWAALVLLFLLAIDQPFNDVNGFLEQISFQLNRASGQRALQTVHSFRSAHPNSNQLSVPFLAPPKRRPEPCAYSLSSLQCLERHAKCASADWDALFSQINSKAAMSPSPYAMTHIVSSTSEIAMSLPNSVRCQNGGFSNFAFNSAVKNRSTASTS